MHLEPIGRGCSAALWWIGIFLDTLGWSRTSDGYPDSVLELLLICSISPDLHFSGGRGTNREETLKRVLSQTALLCFRFLSMLLGGKSLCVYKMPPPGPSWTGISIHEGHQGIVANIFCWVFLLFLFFSTPSFLLVLDRFHLPLSLEHCLTVHLFSLCISSLPPVFSFVSRLLFLFSSPWFSLGFQFWSSLQLSHSLHLPSTPECLWGPVPS